MCLDLKINQILTIFNFLNLNSDLNMFLRLAMSFWLFCENFSVQKFTELYQPYKSNSYFLVKKILKLI